MENRPDKNYGNGNHQYSQQTLWRQLTFFSLPSALGGACYYCYPLVESVNSHYVIATDKLASIQFLMVLMVGFVIGTLCVYFIRFFGYFLLVFVEKRVRNTWCLNIVITFLYLWAFIWMLISGMFGSLGGKLVLVLLI